MTKNKATICYETKGTENQNQISPWWQDSLNEGSEHVLKKIDKNYLQILLFSEPLLIC